MRRYLDPHLAPRLAPRLHPCLAPRLAPHLTPHLDPHMEPHHLDPHLARCYNIQNQSTTFRLKQTCSMISTSYLAAIRGYKHTEKPERQIKKLVFTNIHIVTC